MTFQFGIEIVYFNLTLLKTAIQVVRWDDSLVYDVRRPP